MDVRECILKRRSIRKFKDDLVSDSDIALLLEAAMAAPSACNKKPWEFYVIKDKSYLNAIKSVSRFAKYNAPLAIVVCGNKNKSLSNKDNDFWIQDCSAAIENILLTAVSLGLGSVWCGLYPINAHVNKARDILGVDDSIVPLALVYIGYPLEEPVSRINVNDDCVHYL